MASQFNLVNYESDLEAAGVPHLQAAAHAKALAGALAEVVNNGELGKVETNLRNEIHRCEERLLCRIDQVRVELNTRIDKVHSELHARIDKVHCELNAKIDKVHSKLNARIDLLDAKLSTRIDAIGNELVVHRWMFGLLISINVATLSLVIKITPT